MTELDMCILLVDQMLHKQHLVVVHRGLTYRWLPGDVNQSIVMHQFLV